MKMKLVVVLASMFLLSGCALLVNPIVQQSAIHVVKAIIATTNPSMSPTANAWLGVLEVTLRESARVMAHTNPQNPHSYVYLLTKGG